MKPLFSLLIGFSLLTHSAKSQSWRIAPTLGLNASAITYSSAFRNNLNSNNLNTIMGLLAKFQFGAYVDYAFSYRFSVRSGLLYAGKGGSLHITEAQYGITQSLRGSYKFNYLEIPLLLNIAVGNSNFRVVGGPILSVALNGKGTLEGGHVYGYGYFTGNVTNFRIGSGLTDQVLPLELGASLGLIKELTVADWPLEIGLHVQPSFKNWNTLSKTRSDYYARNLLVGLRVTYLFELRR